MSGEKDVTFVNSKTILDKIMKLVVYLGVNPDQMDLNPIWKRTPPILLDCYFSATLFHSKQYWVFSLRCFQRLVDLDVILTPI